MFTSKKPKVFTIDRTNTSYKELNHILNKTKVYPVQARDVDGTALWISWTEPEGGKPYCELWEPGTLESGTKVTNYYKDGTTAVHYKKH